MIDSTEALVIGIMGIYTMVIVVGIHRYESKLKKLQKLADAWQRTSLEHETQNQQIQAVFQQVHNQNQLLSEQNKELRMQAMMLQNEISELRSGLYTGYPAPTVGSSSTDYNTRLQEIRDQGGMGIVNADILSPRE